MNKSIEQAADAFVQMHLTASRTAHFIAGAKHQKELSDAREKLLLDVIGEMQMSLEYYKSNAMTFKHCDEVTPDVEDYCNGEIAEDTLSSVAKKLEGL